MFSKETYIKRRNELKKRIGKGLLLFLGNDESGMNYADNTYTFRQDSTFLYYFGLDHAGLCAMIDIDNDKEIIFGNELTIDDIVWMGTQPTLVERSAEVGVSETMPISSLSIFSSSVRAAQIVIDIFVPVSPLNSRLFRNQRYRNCYFTKG